MQILSRRTFGLAVALAAGVGLAAAPQAAKAQWQPQKPVEFIIMAGAGGGADQIARLLQSLIERKDLSPVPFIPINKPGGSGAEALRYLQDKAGDEHTVLVTLNSFYTTPLIQKDLGVDVSKFTPIGLMALDTFLLWVNAEEDIHTLDDWVAAVKGTDKYVVGGTGSGQEDSILFAMIEAEFGLDNITYIPFPGGGTVAKNLVGKHISATVNNPAEQNEFWRAGNTRPIVQFVPERMELYPDVPTSNEEGHDIVYFMQRSINGPPDMPAEAREYYMNVFKTLFDSQEWQDYCKSDGLTCENWVGGDDLGKFHAEQLDRHADLIEKVGAAAITGE